MGVKFADDSGETRGSANYGTPFVVFSLPRSRSAWLSRFLSHGGYHCGHEEVRHCRTLDDVAAWFSQPLTGTVETAAAPWWRLLPRFAPNARVAVVCRPVSEVVDSLMRIEGLAFDRATLTRNMEWLDRKLGQIIWRVPGAIAVDYEDLLQEETCARLFEHCLSIPHDSAHWRALADINIQIDMPAMRRYADAYAPALGRLAAAATRQVLADMARRKPVAPSGMTFQREPFDVWLRDGTDLFAQHCTVVGEDPDQWRRKNLPLMQSLYDAGTMHLMTARCNGRMFGYLMTIVSPSLVTPGVISGSNTTFFASPEYPGLGLKLQRAAMCSLRDAGVNEVFFEAGKRGSGERLGAMYRRLGAAEHGQVYRLSLTGDN